MARIENEQFVVARNLPPDACSAVDAGQAKFKKISRFD
jgi:hypothetical protein